MDTDLRYSVYRRKGRKGWTLEYWQDGKPKQPTFPTKTEAEAEWERIKARRHASEGLGGDRDFAEYARKWLSDTRVGVRHGTYTRYVWAVEKHLIPAFPASLRQIATAAVKDLVVAKRHTLEKKTVANIKGTLHSILESAVEDGIIRTNPASYRARQKSHKLTLTRAERRAKIKAFTFEEWPRFKAACAEHEPRWFLYFLSSYWAALRPGEAMALRPACLDYKRGKVRLSENWTPQRRVEPIKTGTAGEVFEIDLAPELAPLLRQHEADQKAEALRLGRPRHDWLFPSRAGTPLDHGVVAAAFARVLKHAELPPHFTPHCLRHTCLTHLLMIGKPVNWVQQHARHATVEMTVGTYGSWLPKEDPNFLGDLEARHRATPQASATEQG